MKLCIWYFRLSDYSTNIHVAASYFTAIMTWHSASRVLMCFKAYDPHVMGLKLLQNWMRWFASSLSSPEWGRVLLNWDLNSVSESSYCFTWDIWSASPFLKGECCLFRWALERLRLNFCCLFFLATVFIHLQLTINPLFYVSFLDLYLLFMPLWMTCILCASCFVF